MIQLSHVYMTTGKTIALTISNFVGQVMSLLFNMLSKFVSFPSKQQVSFNFMAAVTIYSVFGAQENKICHCFHFFTCLNLIFSGNYSSLYVSKNRTIWLMEQVESYVVTETYALQKQDNLPLAKE